MRVLISGASGLIGSSLIPFLTTAGHGVTRLVRGQPKTNVGEIGWDPDQGTIDSAALEGFDAVVHLAGHGIADQRWSDEVKAKIRNSRVIGTGQLAEALAKLERPPSVLVCASAIGYYGDRGEEVLREDSPADIGFLAEVCREWEAAADPARRRGIRVVHTRFGVVLSPAGGALAAMLGPFRKGLGGKVGSGRQYMSWISIDDTVGAIHHVLTNEALEGPVNTVAPHAVTNREFTKTLGRVLRRPTIFAMPGFAARLVFGEMANELLLASTRVDPAKLRASAYAFRHPDLEGALRHVLGKPALAETAVAH